MLSLPRLFPDPPLLAIQSKPFLSFSQTGKQKKGTINRQTQKMKLQNYNIQAKDE